MTRVIAYVDGFNLYYGLTAHRKRTPGALLHNKLDLWQLIENHLLHDGETLEAVRWFSAQPPDGFDDLEQRAVVQRYKQYRWLLERSGVDVRVSEFRKSIRRCDACGKRTKTHQEKESDARAVLEILEDALSKRMDRALIVSSDSDFVPVLYSLKRHLQSFGVDAVICPPVEREASAKEILKVCHRLFGNRLRRMRPQHIKRSLFDWDPPVQ